MKAEVLEQGTLELAAQLAHSEEKIERATRGAFYEVGLELRHIRDHKLYRLQYTTFDEYVEGRWDWSRIRAYQLIEAATATEQMLTIVNILPSRESQVRALLKLPKSELRAEVWRRVVESGENITAKVVEAEVERKLAELNKDWYTLSEWHALDVAERRRLLTQVYTGGAFNETNENIEWAAFSWNPITGCQHGCPYCYARGIANRFYVQKFEPAIYPNRLSVPQYAKPGKPRWENDQGQRGVFVCSMADLFGEWVPQEWIDAVIEAVRRAPEWNFIFLTKNPERFPGVEWPDNAWVGTTVDRQDRVIRAEEAFRKVQAKVRFVSCEPMLEALNFHDMSMFDWAIIGGQTEANGVPAFQPNWSWVEHLHNTARLYGCVIYWKPNLQVRPREYPEG